jgi:serine/threonine protein phosphatase 1
VQRTVIVGDIHGCFDELLDWSKVDLRPDDLLVSVGDLVDLLLRAADHAPPARRPLRRDGRLAADAAVLLRERACPRRPRRDAAAIALADQKEEILCGSTSGERELTALFPDSYQ